MADIAAVLLASTEAPAPSAAAAIYNVADDEPAPRAEVRDVTSEPCQACQAATHRDWPCQAATLPATQRDGPCPYISPVSLCIPPSEIGHATPGCHPVKPYAEGAGLVRALPVHLPPSASLLKPQAHPTPGDGLRQPPARAVARRAAAGG